MLYNDSSMTRLRPCLNPNHDLFMWHVFLPTRGYKLFETETMSETFFNALKCLICILDAGVL